MLNKLIKVLTIQETESPRAEQVLNVLIRGSMAVAAILIAVSIALLYAAQGGYWMIGGPILLAILFGLGRLNQQGRVSLTANLYVATIILYATLAEPLDFPTDRLNLLVYAVPIVVAALLISPAAGPVWAGIATAAILIRTLILAILGQADDYADPVLIVTGLNTVAAIMWVFGRSFRQVQSELHRQLQQGQAGIEIGHTVTAALDAPSIIRQAVQLIQGAFGYYHVALFVVDPEGETAALMDAAGEAASDLKERGFHVPLAGMTAVAAAISQKRLRKVVSWEESVDARGRPIQFTYERLSLPGQPGLATRVELVIPLQVRERVLGALDLHSTELEAFPEEDIHTLEGLAGHIANALERARLLDDIQRRHQELETIYEQTDRRARYLETTAELARAISSLIDPEELLDTAVNLVSRGLDLYHAGIFLVDEAREWAVLTAASSEGGKRMLARGHKLRVGEQGIVGWATGTGEPRIALDVGADAVYFDNPDLPDTRSEIALPLKVGDRVIGALDVQSMREAAFSDEDAVVLQTLADQITIAVENARLFQQTQQALKEVQALQRYYVAQEWERLSVQRSDLNAEYRGLGVSSLDVDWTPEMDMAWVQETPVVLPNLGAADLEGDGRGDGRGDEAESSPHARAALAIPIKLRDEVIGVLDLQETDKPRQWTEEEVAMATTVADQLALALENARLFEEAQRRASQLAAAAEVARDATAILDVDRLLNETIDLISKQFGFYHAGAFLLDEQNEYAVLQAASSEGGQRMLAREHKLKVGEVGIVGYVAGTGEPRVALDVGTDAVYFDNPDLPNTRSEMALPLKVRERVIGVLDVQSTQKAAFSEDDMAVLQTLADQLATAIANANLFQRVREDSMRRALINEVNQAAASSLDVEELLDRAGEAISRQLEMPCVIFEWDFDIGALKPISIHNAIGMNVTPLEPSPITAEMDPTMFQALQTRQLQVLFNAPTHVHDAAAQLVQQIDLLDAAYIPLMSRDQILGLVTLGRQRGHPALDEGELSFLEVVAVNLGVALENARLYQEAVETAERLAEVDRLKSQFLANMSHELRTPLNSIIGFSRVILKGIDGPLTEMQKTDLQTVYDSGQYLLGLINDILDISKIEAGKMEIALEDVDLIEIINGVMSTAIALVKDKPVELEHSVAPDIPAIKGDVRRIRQVLLNLVSNAAKFTEEGFIRVEAEANPTEVTIAVSDSGIGIPEENLGTIFEPFTQVDGSSTRSAGGTGLGLSICKSFVEIHGGHMWVESAPGVGSVFYFTLPIEGPPFPEREEEELDLLKEAAEAPVSVIEVGDRAGKLVLCVEDDEGVITLFRRYLSKQGYQVVGLTDPTRVMEETKRLRPYAITLDVMMPEKDGWQVIQELKADAETNHIPVIICSIVAEKGRGLSLGASDYLVKPVLEQDLLAALDRLNREEGRHLVLVVDDQPEHRQLLRRMIESQDGYEVIEASGGQEAIELLHAVRPHIIMLDLMMPEMDGFAVLETVKTNEATRSIPIVVVTAKELTKEDRERLNNHVAALVQKGLMNQDELLEDVAAALRKLTRHLP
jgi:GAF domain-containing protein/DNA-binding response OmpR family regulator